MTSKKYDVHINWTAIFDIENHVEFLANVSLSAAGRLSKKIYKSIDSLDEQPYQWPIYFKEETDMVYRNMVIDKRYTILYTIDESLHQVTVKDVWDTRMDNHI